MRDFDSIGNRWLALCLVLWCACAIAEPARVLAQESTGDPPAAETDSAETDSADGETATAESGEAVYQPITTVTPQIPLDQLEILVKPLTKSELQGEADAWLELLRTKARRIAAVQMAIKKTNEAIQADNGETAVAAIKVADAIRRKAELRDQEAQRKMAEQAREQLGVGDQMDVGDPEQSPSEQSPEEEPSVSDADATELNLDAISDSGVVEGKKDALLGMVNQLQDERTALADRLEVVLTSLEAKGGEVEEYRNYAVAVSGIDLDATDASATWAAIVGWLTSKEGGQRWARNFATFLLILLITWMAARILAAVVNWLLERKVRLSSLAEKLISRTIKNVILVIGFAIALTALEVDVTPILAAIGATGFIVGFALQGTLSNFASGLMILINRPFDEGDVVSAGGVTGTINQMNLVSTTFRTFDNQTIHVPNNEIWGSVITNITANSERRVDLEFGIGYDDDFEQAEQIIREVVTEHELVLEDPEPQVVMHELGDSCVKIVCRPWAKTSDWWTVKTEVTRRVKQRFDAAGISIPYPQRDVHVYQHGS